MNDEENDYYDSNFEEEMNNEENDYCDSDNEENDYEYQEPYPPEEEIDWERETFYALTGGQYGDYDDYKESGGDIDDLEDSLGY